jgi:hypothetical protein
MTPFIIAMDLAALTVIAAVGQPPMVQTNHAYANSIYVPYVPDNQTFPNPDRDFFGDNVRQVD